MGLNMIVMVKQVPDTQNITGEAMKPDGTVNRAALPSVFNPEDLNALEEALRIKDTFGGNITAITMGPPMAVSVLRECMYRGADDVILLSDRQFAGADTLATSYALSCAIRKVGGYDLVFCGRQAIDGDTAQVGPQIAEKLGINQLTGITKIVEIDGQTVTVKRSVENGMETLKSDLPVLLTVTGEANEPRPPSAKKVMAYKHVGCAPAGGRDVSDDVSERTCKPMDIIQLWNLVSIGAAPERCGLSGSPTKVKKVQNVVLTTGDARQIPNTDMDIAGLMHELIEDNIIG